MTTISIRDLRSRGGDVVDRVAAGERVTITRDGRPVAELRAIRPATTLSAATLLERWQRLPPMRTGDLRRDVDAVFDPSL